MYKSILRYLLRIATEDEIHRRVNLPDGRQGYGVQVCDATKVESYNRRRAHYYSLP